MANKGDWVQIHIEVLSASERAANIPEDTKKVPLEMWVKGELQNEEASIGDPVSVVTKTGRIVEGTLVDIAPCYTHSFGDYVPELDQIDRMVKNALFGGQNHVG